MSWSASGAAWSSVRQALPRLHSCHSSASRQSGGRTGQAPRKPAARGALASVSALRRPERSPHDGGCRSPGSVARREAARELRTKRPTALGRGSHVPGCPSCSPVCTPDPSPCLCCLHTSMYLLQGASCKPEQHTVSSLAVFSFVCCASAGPTPDRGAPGLAPFHLCLCFCAWTTHLQQLYLRPKRMLPPFGLVKREFDCYKRRLEGHRPPHRVWRSPSRLTDVLHSQNSYVLHVLSHSHPGQLRQEFFRRPCFYRVPKRVSAVLIVPAKRQSLVCPEAHCVARKTV